jgi:hypothetical protein
MPKGSPTRWLAGAGLAARSRSGPLPTWVCSLDNLARSEVKIRLFWVRVYATSAYLAHVAEEVDFVG